MKTMLGVKASRVFLTAIIHACLIIVLCASPFALSGCATNGVTVHEKTADGYEFSMNQRTTSTMFASTEEGAGSVDYEGTSPDGSGFKLRAGAAVSGQQGGDPSALILGIFQAVMPVLSQKMQAEAAQPDEAQVAIDAEQISVAIDLIEQLMERQRMNAR